MLREKTSKYISSQCLRIVPTFFFASSLACVLVLYGIPLTSYFHFPLPMRFSTGTGAGPIPNPLLLSLTKADRVTGGIKRQGQGLFAYSGHLLPPVNYQITTLISQLQPHLTIPPSLILSLQIQL